MVRRYARPIRIDARRCPLRRAATPFCSTALLDALRPRSWTHSQGRAPIFVPPRPIPTHRKSATSRRLPASYGPKPCHSPERPRSSISKVVASVTPRSAAMTLWLSPTIGRASCRDRVRQYVQIAVVDVSCNKKKQHLRIPQYLSLHSIYTYIA